ncbi:hypothetical protein A6X21_01600 [Planctopirus hydrillae]|uniref:Uncharacterized protein n=1 Tax=Planctopirus hydrillae TaxID=1841610 RepID=A0A1C3EUF1_9PLAN|nr:hypothetical protein A6X21_01600 [Planctopirus hydrillae]
MPSRSRRLCFLFRRKFSREGNAADGDIKTGDIEEEKREVNLVASDGASQLGSSYTHIFISAEFISG